MYIERDNTVLYSILLIMVSVIIFFILNILQMLFIDPRISKLENSIEKQNQNIQTFNSIKQSNGELFVKSEVLTPVLLKDIGINKFLDVANSLTQDSNAIPINYARESSGLFVISFFSDSYTQAGELITRAKSHEALTDVFVRQLIFDETELKIRTTIAFNIVGDE